MMKFIVRRQAEDDIDEIAALIAKDNLTAALRFCDRAQETFDRIAAWPMVGTARKVKHLELQGTRSYPIRGFRNYLVFYRPSQAEVEILHVIHGSRDI